MFGHTNEPFVLTRDVSAVIIPAGEKLHLRKGTSGFITQALGGSFTIYIEGNLFRIAGSDADSIGKECESGRIEVNLLISDTALSLLGSCFRIGNPVQLFLHF